MSEGDRTCGWNSDFPIFRDTALRVVRESLQEFVLDASPEQVSAWNDSIPRLQKEAAEVVKLRSNGADYTAILEYRLPLESRRPDFVVLSHGPVVVVELKGKLRPSQADLDQVAAYVRDLRCYHRECHNRPVRAVLVPTRALDTYDDGGNVYIVSPDRLDRLLCELETDEGLPPLTAESFLDIDAYRPLPSLIDAARELFESRTIREVWRAHAATDPAVETISHVAHLATRNRTRHLVLITGVPGSGKTLVGLRVVHAKYLDDLAIERAGSPSVIPGVFLSGNGPLVEVLQYQLRASGGGGKTFVRGVKDYLDTYVPNPNRIPNEHVIVFDEAQRAFSQDMVKEKHGRWPEHLARSEPEHFIELCERIPEWCVLVGLIGGGQEIHKGEEEGLIQWREALERSRCPDSWAVHAPGNIQGVFEGSPVLSHWEPSLNLDTEIRFHLTPALHDFVECVLESEEIDGAQQYSEILWQPDPDTPIGVSMWVTRNLAAAKEYLWERYAENPNARYGIVASSKDRLLEPTFDIPNSYMATQKVKLGPWYTHGQESLESCRNLNSAVTEFGAQGLELDMTLLAWGRDLIRVGGKWSSRHAGGYRGNVAVKDPHQLRINAYRVLLTRGRDGTVIFMPPLPEFEETWRYLLDCGFRELSA